MKVIDYQSEVYDKITDRFKQDPVFLAIIRALIDLKVLRQQQYINISDTILDLDKSTGKNLDLIGNLIGQPRQLINFIDKPFFGFIGARSSEPFDVGYWYSLYKDSAGTLKILNDVDYRRVLKARIIKNNTNGSRNDLLNIINLLTNNTSTIIDEQPKSEVDYGVIKITLNDTNGIASYFISKYKSQDSLIPIPLGVRLETDYI